MGYQVMHPRETFVEDSYFGRLGWKVEDKRTMTKTGVVFCSTGGNKMVRALRSFRRAEPDLAVHISFNTSSPTWGANRMDAPYEYFTAQPNVYVRLITTDGYINGAFNAAMHWMEELGFTHACMFHDDVVFSPLPENIGHISEWLSRLDSDPELQSSCGLSLSCMEALVHTQTPGVWERSPTEWDKRDLESESVWRKLLPGGKPALYFGSPGSDEGVQIPLVPTEQNVSSDLALSDWFAKYFVTDRVCTMARLGPSGAIVPIDVWRQLGTFDEQGGIFYDMEYPVICALRGLPPVKVIPNVPYLHIHNQTTAFGDPAVGLWGRDMQSFILKYKKDPGAFLRALPGTGGY